MPCGVCGLSLRERIDRHKECENISVVLAARAFGLQRGFQLGGFACIRDANFQFARAIPDRLPVRTIGAKFCSELFLRAEICGLADTVSRKRQHGASTAFQDECAFPGAVALSPAHRGFASDWVRRRTLGRMNAETLGLFQIYFCRIPSECCFRSTRTLRKKLRTIQKPRRGMASMQMGSRPHAR